MSSTVFSMDKFYRTQPPQQISALKVSSVLEYLAFSGSPIFLSIGGVRVEEAAVVVDVKEDGFLMQLPQIKFPLKAPALVEGSFGYKRKRAEFKSEILKIENNLATIVNPQVITLTNLRRNPRVAVDKDLARRGMKILLRGKSAVGDFTIHRAEIHEFSQLGMSMFIDRSEGLLLPGDGIEELDVTVNDVSVLKTVGVVNRVNMKRSSESVPNSYELVILFRDRKTSKGEQARASKRTPILDTKPCYFSAEHPFFPGRRIEGQVFEVSAAGMSCLLEKTSFPIIPGMRFTNCNLQLPHKPSREFMFEVAHVDFRSDGAINQFKLGGEFVSAPIELVKDISSYSQEVAGGVIKDVSDEDFDLLWEFMFETNFIYQNKRRQIQSKSKEILETYHRLLAVENSVVKKIVFKEDQEIRGHVSAIRFFDHCWVIQHLNALKASGASAAQAMISGIVNFFYDARANANTETFYVMSFYRPDNLYPAILFGESCRRINDPLKSTYFDLAFGNYNSPTEKNLPFLDKVLTDSPAAYIDLSNLLIRNNMIAFMRAVGLGMATTPDLKIQPKYMELGLFRERHLLSLSHENESVYALVEMASPGLNLSELTNAVYLFTEGLNEDNLKTLSETILEKAHQTYFAPREMSPCVLQRVGEQRASTVEWSKIYTCWITSAANISSFESAAATVINDFRTLVSNFKESLEIKEVKRA